MKPSTTTKASTLAWTWLPAVLLSLLALPFISVETNTAWFKAWNQAGQILPAAFWSGVTNLGSTGGAFALLTGLLHRRPRWAAAALLAAPAATVFTHALKKFFSEARPAAVLPPEQITIIGETLKANAFPSGHSVTAFGIAAAVALCCVARGRQRLAWFALAIAVLAAFSRVVVGAHWPLDILVGGAGGWLCGALGVWWSARWRFWERSLGLRVLAVILGASAGWLFFDDLGYPQGTWAQYCLAVLGLTGALYALFRSFGRTGRS